MYLRQSLDTDAGNAIERQRAGCVERIATKGWAGEPLTPYVDNGVSATDGRERPAYAALLRDVRAGLVDVVVAWNLDRLSRRPRELEDWFDLNRAHGVNLLTSEGADLVDLSSETGRLVLRMTIAVASMEGERKARRQRESNAQARDQGLPPAGRRAFGYTARVASAKAVLVSGATRTSANGSTWPDYGHEPLEPEAGAVRHAFADLLAGSPLYAIARGLNRSGFTTTDGKAWSPQVVRMLLCSPRSAGLVRPPKAETGRTRFDRSDYDLAALRPGTWEPLVTADTWHAAQAVLRDPSRRTNPGNTRAHLLSGLARCGEVRDGQPCGALVKSSHTRAGLRAYKCPHHHMTRQADRADELVTEVVLERLRQPDAHRLLERQDAPDLARLRTEYAEARARRDTLPGLYAEGVLDAEGLRRATRTLDAKLGDLVARMGNGGMRSRIGDLVEADDPAEVWASLALERRRAVVEALLAITMVSPGIGAKSPRDYAAALEHTARSVRLDWKAAA